MAAGHPAPAGRCLLGSGDTWGKGGEYVAICADSGCKTDVGRIGARGLCPKHYRQWLRGTYKADAWLLPEDGIIDRVAIYVAVKGLRPVRMTQAEREIAGARILAAGGTEEILVERLSLPNARAARALALRIRQAENK